MPAASSASRTAARSPASVVTCQTSPSSCASSAPASAACSTISSSSSWSDDTSTTPLRSNCHATEPGVPRLALCLLKIARTSAAVRLRLSVSASTMMATPSGP